MSQIDEVSDVVPTYLLSGRRAHQRNNGPPSTSVLEEAAPPALAMQSDSSVSPHMSLLPFVLSPSTGVQSE